MTVRYDPTSRYLHKIQAKADRLEKERTANPTSKRASPDNRSQLADTIAATRLKAHVAAAVEELTHEIKATLAAAKATLAAAKATHKAAPTPAHLAAVREAQHALSRCARVPDPTLRPAAALRKMRRVQRQAVASKLATATLQRLGYLPKP